MEAEFAIRESRGRDDCRELELLGFPPKHVRQYTNALPLYYIAKKLRVCTSYLYLLTQGKSGRIVGTILIRCVISPSEARYVWKMHAVFVAPELRGRGLGIELVRYALEKLRERRVKEVSLKVDQDNVVAVHLYAKCGFVEKARTKSQIVMVRCID